MERPGIAETLDSLAAVAARRGDPRTGALLIGAADARARRRRAARQPDEEVWLAPIEAALRETLGDEAFEAARAEGARARARRRPGPRASSCRSAHADVRRCMPASSWSGSEQ